MGPHILQHDQRHYYQLRWETRKGNNGILVNGCGCSVGIVVVGQLRSRRSVEGCMVEAKLERNGVFILFTCEDVILQIRFFGISGVTKLSVLLLRLSTTLWSVLKDIPEFRVLVV
jgi:hypothetical protein